MSERVAEGFAGPGPAAAEAPDAEDRRRVVKWKRALIELSLIAIPVCVVFIDPWIAQHLVPSEPHWALNAARQFGDSAYYLIPTAIAALLCWAASHFVASEEGQRFLRWFTGANLFLFAAVAYSGIIVAILKGVIGRARPKLLFGDNFYGFDPFHWESKFASLPSGHANTMLVIMVALAFFAPRLRPYLIVFAAIGSFARVIGGAHYFADIIAGGALGVLTTYWLRDYFAERGWVFHRLGNGEIALQWPGRAARGRLSVMGMRSIDRLRGLFQGLSQGRRRQR